MNEEGFEPPNRSTKFSDGILTCFLRDYAIRTGKLPNSLTQENHLEPDEWWLTNLAAKLAMPIATLHRWQRVGWLNSRKVTATGRWAIFANADELDRLTRLRKRLEACPTLTRKS